MTNIVEQMEVAVQAAVEAMPYQWIGPNYGVGGVEFYNTLREFFEDTWQGDNADEVFKDAAAAAVQSLLPFIEAAKAEGRREVREEEQRCPQCGVKFQLILDVDKHLSALGDTPC